jgi:hypothetical protein
MRSWHLWPAGSRGYTTTVWWCGGSKDGCYNYGDLDHFVVSCPKKRKSESGPRDHHSGRRKGKYSSGKYKSKRGFDKEALKKYLQKEKIKEHAFLASLSDLDHVSDDVVSSSSDEETKRRVEDKLNRLCFIADTAGGFCTMALGEDVDGTNDDKDIDDGTTSDVLPSVDDLTAKIEELNAALASQDKLLKQAAHERREFRSQYKSMLRELESARALVEVSDETECDECALHMSNITTLQTKYSTLLDEHDELRSRSILLGACTICPGLQTELAERDARIALLEKASSVSAPAPTQCALCEGLQSALESCRHDKTRMEEENTYLRSILSWVSCSDPQLGMMVSQFKRGAGGPGLGFATKDGSVALFGKVGECSGLTPSEKPSPTPKLIKTTSAKPVTPVRDGVIDEPMRDPPQKQVWLPKPNHLRNTLDTFPNISSDSLPRAPKPSKKKAPSYKQNPPKREVRYHCKYCERNGHLASFCFRRKRDERRVSESSMKDMNRPSHSVHAQPVQRRPRRPRGVLPLAARPQAMRPRGGRARRDAGRVPYGQGPVIDALVHTSPADHNFLLVVIASLRDRGCLVFSLTLFRGKYHSTGILQSLLTPVLCHLLTPCLTIDAGQRPGKHVAHGFQLFAPHDQKLKMVLQPRPYAWYGTHHIRG